MRGDFDGAGKTLALARDALAPLARADPRNITFHVDVLSVDFEFARLLVLEGRFRDAQTAIVKVIAAFEALHEEEDTGPGMGVMYAWLGEAQFGVGKFAQSLQSFRKSAQLLEADVQYSDGICGIITEYTRIGDALVKLGHPSEAESAYQTALAKTDAALAAKHADVAALTPISAAHAGMADLHFVAASSVRDSAVRDTLRAQACQEYRQAHELRQLIPVAWTFNPSNFPAAPQSSTDSPPACNQFSGR